MEEKTFHNLHLTSQACQNREVLERIQKILVAYARTDQMKYGHSYEVDTRFRFVFHYYERPLRLVNFLTENAVEVSFSKENDKLIFFPHTIDRALFRKIASDEDYKQLKTFFVSDDVDIQKSTHLIETHKEEVPPPPVSDPKSDPKEDLETFLRFCKKENIYCVTECENVETEEVMPLVVGERILFKTANLPDAPSFLEAISLYCERFRVTFISNAEKVKEVKGYWYGNPVALETFKELLSAPLE